MKNNHPSRYLFLSLEQTDCRSVAVRLSLFAALILFAGNMVTGTDDPISEPEKVAAETPALDDKGTDDSGEEYLAQRDDPVWAGYFTSLVHVRYHHRMHERYANLYLWWTIGLTALGVFGFCGPIVHERFNVFWSHWWKRAAVPRTQDSQQFVRFAWALFGAFAMILTSTARVLPYHRSVAAHENLARRWNDVSRDWESLYRQVSKETIDAPAAEEQTKRLMEVVSQIEQAEPVSPDWALLKECQDETSRSLLVANNRRSARIR